VFGSERSSATWILSTEGCYAPRSAWPSQSGFISR
jgi:hypothetical protein